MVEYLDVILKGKRNIPCVKNTFVVYFLLKKEKVVYIGSSENFLVRLGSHLKDKDFDSYHFVELRNKEEMLRVEAENIIYYNPLYNKGLPESFVTLTYLKNYLLKKGYRIDLRQIKKFIKENNIQVSLYNFTMYIPKETCEKISIQITGENNAKK